MDGKREQGGASRRAGGREERPPQNSAQGAERTIGRWIPPSSVKRDVLDPQESRHDGVFRRVRGILNKLAPEKFDKLSLELLNVGIDSQLVLKGIILLIFEKALEEPKYSSLYAQLCHRLCEDAPNFEPASSNITTFRRLLLNKCQDEFENRSRATEEFDKKNGPLTPDEEEARSLAKWKMLGNIKFIGELGKLEMLHEGILHRCIKQLLEKKKSSTPGDMSEDLECLCQIMRTVGPRLDSEKARAWMDQYFERMKAYKFNYDLPARIRFLLQDCIELRENEWQNRPRNFDNGPKTITEVRQQAAKDFGVFYPPPGSRGGHMMNMPMNMNNFDRMNGPMFPSGPRMGMNDMFGPAPQSFMGPGSIGTGPGVIPMDGFGGGMHSYSSNMGRMRMQNQKGFQNFGKRDGGGGNSPRFQNNQDHEQGYNSPRYNKEHQQNGRDESRSYNDKSDQNDRSYSGDRKGRDNNDRNDRHYDRHYNDRSSYNDDQRGRYNDRRSGYNNRGGYQQQRGTDRGNVANNAQGSKALPPRFQKKLLQSSSPNELETDNSPFPNSSPEKRSNTPPSAPRNNTPPMGAITTDGEISLRPVDSGHRGRNHHHGGGDVNLRPAHRGFAPMFKPGVPSMLPKSAQMQHNMPQNQWNGPEPDFLNKPAILTQQVPIVVKPAPERKEKKEPPKEKNKKFTMEDLNEGAQNMLKTFLETKDGQKAVAAVKDMKVPNQFLPNLVSILMTKTLDKSDEDREELNNLMKTLKDAGLVDSEQFMTGLTNLLGKLSTLEMDVPLVRSYTSKYAAMAVANDIISLVQLAEPLKNGAHYPLFMLCLQQLHKIKDENWLVEVFNDSKIDLQTMLPEADRNKERMMEILEDRGLNFMFPLLRIQNELNKQMKADPNPTTIYKWIKDNVDQSMYTHPEFIHTLTTVIVRYATENSTNEEAPQTNGKESTEKDNQRLDKFKGVLQNFLHDNMDLQLLALYAVQVYLFHQGFPKGVLLRLFMKLYDYEIIDEETFLKWKEEVNDDYPGKGKALFQVNQWLTWLEEADEESEEEDEEED